MSSEELIKNAFEQDIKDLTEETETKGAPTSTEKPKSLDRPLLRPNGRFLRNTIASITASNRRIEENEMRAGRKAQQERTPSVCCNEDGINGKETNKEGQQSPSRGKTTAQDGPGEAQLVEEQPEQQGGYDGVGGGALQRKVRGRGGTGPRVVGLEIGVLVESEQGLKRINSSPSEPEKEQRRKLRSRSRSNSSDSSSSDSSSEEEIRKRRSKKRRKKEKEERKDDKHKRKEKRRKKEKKEKRRRQREKKSKKEKKSKRSYSSDSSDSDSSS